MLLYTEKFQAPDWRQQYPKQSLNIFWWWALEGGTVTYHKSAQEAPASQANPTPRSSTRQTQAAAFGLCSVLGKQVK